MLFGSRIDLCLVCTKSRDIRTFWKVRSPLFSSSGNQSFRYTVRFTSTLSFECSCVRPISPGLYRFRILQPFRAIAFAYFSFRVRSVEFVFLLRSCCWLGLVRVQFVCFFLPFPSISSHHRKFFPFTVLSSNSESVRKIAITFTYELQFQCSIYRNQSDKNFGSVCPSFWWVWKFRTSKFTSKVWVFTPWSFFSHFSQS